MELTESKKGDFLVIQVAGRLDTSNYGELEKRLLGHIGNGQMKIVVDCSEMVYISSSGLRVFLMALKKIVADGGTFHLCCLQENIREIFEIAGFTSIFTIFNTQAEAVQ